MLDISVSKGFLCIKYQVLRAETESVLRRYFSHSTIFFFDSTLPSRSHEVLPYYLALFLFCDPADMDVKIFFSVASLEFTSTVFLLHGSRDLGDCSSG